MRPGLLGVRCLGLAKLAATGCGKACSVLFSGQVRIAQRSHRVQFVGPWQRACRAKARSGRFGLCGDVPALHNLEMLTVRPLPRFALAKIQPPRPRPGMVARPVLERALTDALAACRLVLLLAPAGYGKTVALTRQLRQLPPAWVLAWVSADGEDQLQRFLACLTAALEPHRLPWRVAPEALATLAAGELGLHDVAREIVNALACAEVERGLVVIDDAHRLIDPRVFELLQLMLDRLPDNWGLVMASRVEPPLALARMRVRGELAEFRQHALCFSADELGAWLDDQAIRLAPAQRQELLDRTAGWAAGLQLSLSTRGGASPSVRGETQRHLFDFLATEVLDDMPAELRHFLLRCSVLPELTAARCARVSAQPQAARLLEELERRGLFVSLLDAEDLTLRLHDLFRDFLQDRLQRDHADELPALLRRAAEAEPDLARAVGYLTRAGAWDEATRRLGDEGPELLARGGATGLTQMLALFPAAEFERRPELLWLSGLISLASFDFEALVGTMQRAAAGFAQAGRTTKPRSPVPMPASACKARHASTKPPKAWPLSASATCARAHVPWCVSAAPGRLTPMPVRKRLPAISATCSRPSSRSGSCKSGTVASSTACSSACPT